ncbi:MAG TPA: cytochrome P450 [Nitrososphaeraceae archaeon]|nr:cytochrome P450 [Nitrososphaeraceae archaeon]
MNVIPSVEQRLFPFDFYTDMRNKHPITYDEVNDAYAIFRYQDVRKVLFNFKDYSSDFKKYISSNGQKTISSIFDSSLITSDPPQHKFLRDSIAMAFNPKNIAKLESQIEKITQELLNSVIDNEKMDLIHDFAFPLPVTVIAELLGVPPEDHPKFKKWADQILSSSLLIHAGSDEINKLNLQIREEMTNYFSSIIDSRSKIPENDIISDLIRYSELNDQATKPQRSSLFILSKENIISFCALLLLAGHVTTINLIGNMFISFFEYPSEFLKLKKNPSKLIPLAIEETLRYRSPVQCLVRYTNKDLTIGEEDYTRFIPEGKRIFTWIGSANHDESVFSNPQKFDLNRHPNPHIAFGAGIHLCIGAPLARLEAQVALRNILNYMDDIQLAEPSKPLKAIDSITINGVESLPITFKKLNRNLIKI